MRRKGGRCAASVPLCAIGGYGRLADHGPFEGEPDGESQHHGRQRQIQPCGQLSSRPGKGQSVQDPRDATMVEAEKSTLQQTVHRDVRVGDGAVAQVPGLLFDLLPQVRQLLVEGFMLVCEGGLFRSGFGFLVQGECLPEFAVQLVPTGLQRRFDGGDLRAPRSGRKIRFSSIFFCSTAFSAAI